MQVEPGDFLEQRRLADEGRDVGMLVKDVPQVFEPFLGQEERPGLVAGCEGTAEHSEDSAMYMPSAGSRSLRRWTSVSRV
ncbi:hypothetical protein G205_14503 [Arthrobacter nitrophenolicus]|uniref:Uncharacterized protein n=1 Tax=Arthrobacter nitrophenolicus TaxID=683150 RepID=L8TS35_9MICC|nr:hypothetical protein G205_14503 [Arthrobacter nitrophenolicus]